LNANKTVVDTSLIRTHIGLWTCLDTTADFRQQHFWYAIKVLFIHQLMH